MSDWPKYQSHKVVQAAKIVRLEYRGEDAASGVPRVFVDPGDGVEQEFWSFEPGMMQRAEIGGFAVLYPDGFKSISPAKAFEEGYTPCP